MILESVVCFVGLLHLLQPLMTLLLAAQLGLRPAFLRLPPIAFQVAQNMAVAAVALPTSLGAYIALRAHDVAHGGPTWMLALGVSLFWTWRLERQLHGVGPLLRQQLRVWHPFMVCVFTIQGPILAAVLVTLRVGGAK